MVKRVFLLLLTILFLSSKLNAYVLQGRLFVGRRSRRYYRHALLAKRLQNDKLTIFKEYGYPVHRYRVYAYGRIEEHWKYLDRGIEFVFDQNSNLVKTKHFWPENRRERFERFPGY